MRSVLSRVNSLLRNGDSRSNDSLSTVSRMELDQASITNTITTLSYGMFQFALTSRREDFEVMPIVRLLAYVWCVTHQSRAPSSSEINVKLHCERAQFDLINQHEMVLPDQGISYWAHIDLCINQSINQSSAVWVCCRISDDHVHLPHIVPLRSIWTPCSHRLDKSLLNGISATCVSQTPPLISYMTHLQSIILHHEQGLA